MRFPLSVSDGTVGLPAHRRRNQAVASVNEGVIIKLQNEIAFERCDEIVSLAPPDELVVARKHLETSTLKISYSDKEISSVMWDLDNKLF